MDRYTKGVLTIIAAALVALVLKGCGGAGHGATRRMR